MLPAISKSFNTQNKESGIKFNFLLKKNITIYHFRHPCQQYLKTSKLQNWKSYHSAYFLQK